MVSHDKRTSTTISAVLKEDYGYLYNSYDYLCPNCESIVEIQEYYDVVRCIHLVTISCSECNISANGEISDLALSSVTFNIIIDKMLLELVDPIRQAELELEAEARAERDLPF